MTTKKEGARKKATTTQTASRANLPDGGCVALQRRQQRAQRVESIGKLTSKLVVVAHGHRAAQVGLATLDGAKKVDFALQ